MTTTKKQNSSQKQTKPGEAKARFLPIPDALPQRSDTSSERWRVSDAPPIRGACSTNLAERVMFAPDEMGYTASAVRAHEMTHAAFSPVEGAGTLAPFFGVTVEALAAAEEWRVNRLSELAGVSMLHLTDETEKGTARLIAVRKDWRGAILFTVQTWGTGAQNTVARTLNKHMPPEWKKPLSRFRRVMRDFDKARATDLRNMRTWEVEDSNTKNKCQVPTGFRYSVMLAQHIENKTSKRNDPTLTNEQRRAREEAEARGEEQERRRVEGLEATRKFRRLPEYSKTGSPYEDVRLMQSDLTEQHRGKIATKRTAANVGKKPRRLSRALTDPQRRVFDKRTRSNGGVVVVDMSGSMSLTTEDVDSILNAAGGATVIGYSNIGSERANVWVIAHNGNRVANYPEYGANNDCDAPALRFAASLRKDKREPFIWVSDGRAYHGGSSFTKDAAREIDELTRRHGIHNAPDAQAAVRELQRCARGNRAYTKPSAFVTSRLNEDE